MLVDVGPPGQGLQVTTARLVGSTGPGDWFAWALVGADALNVVAAAAGLAVTSLWQVEAESRWQAELTPTAHWSAPTVPAR